MYNYSKYLYIVYNIYMNNNMNNNMNKCDKCNKIFSTKSYLKKHAYKKYDCLTKQIRENNKNNIIINEKVVTNYFLLVEGSEKYAMLVGKVFSEVLQEYIQKKQLLEQT